MLNIFMTTTMGYPLVAIDPLCREKIVQHSVGLAEALKNCLHQTLF